MRRDLARLLFGGEDAMRARRGIVVQCHYGKARHEIAVGSGPLSISAIACDDREQVQHRRSEGVAQLGIFRTQDRRSERERAPHRAKNRGR